MSKFFQGYTGAVTSAVTIAVSSQHASLPVQDTFTHRNKHLPPSVFKNNIGDSEVYRAEEAGLILQVCTNGD